MDVNLDKLSATLETPKWRAFDPKIQELLDQGESSEGQEFAQHLLLNPELPKFHRAFIHLFLTLFAHDPIEHCLEAIKLYNDMPKSDQTYLGDATLNEFKVTAEIILVFWQECGQASRGIPRKGPSEWHSGCYFASGMTKEKSDNDQFDQLREMMASLAVKEDYKPRDA